MPNPEPLQLREYEWTVITSDRIPSGEDWVLIGVDPRGYEVISENAAEIRRWIEEAMWRLRYYRGELDVRPGDIGGN